MFPTILNDVPAPRATPYKLRNPVSFKMQKLHSVYNGAETLSNLGLKTWSFAPHEIRHFISFGGFKSKIKI